MTQGLRRRTRRVAARLDRARDTTDERCAVRLRQRHVLRDAVGAHLHPDGQIRHYQEMNEKALRWWSITGIVSKWSALLAPPFVAISLANKLSKLEGLQGLLHGPWKLDEKPATWPIVVLFPIALPLLAGVANGIRHALDAGRRKERYPEMAKRLTEMRTHLAGLETRASISLAVAQTEEILLDELREWQLTAKTTGH